MLLLDKNSGEPLYRQVYEQIRQQILREELPAGQRLPATRELAGEYGLSRNTVIRAYRQLELEGYLRAAGSQLAGYACLLALALLLPQRVHRAQVLK